MPESPQEMLSRLRLLLAAEQAMECPTTRYKAKNIAALSEAIRRFELHDGLVEALGRCLRFIEGLRVPQDIKEAAMQVFQGQPVVERARAILAQAQKGQADGP